MTRQLAFVPVLLLMFAAGGCGDDPTPPDPATVEGSWAGTSQGVTLELTLEEPDSGGVFGSGSLSGTAGPDAVTVKSGTHVHPHVSLTLRRDDSEDLNYAGEMTSDFTIEGSLTGGQFDDFPLVLNRQ